MRKVSALVAIFCVSFLFTDFSTQSASAQDSRPLKHGRSDGAVANRLGVRVNQNTVGIISGNPNGTYLRLAYDMSAVLDGDNIRVLPIIGAGGGGNIVDVRFLRGIDLGITQSVLLNRYQRTNEIGPLKDKLVYISKLNNEELHVVVRTDSGINSLQELAGKRVNFSDFGSGTHLSTKEIFERLKIKAVELNMGQADAIEKMKRGEIDATVLIAGKPTGSTARIKASEGFRLLPVAYSRELQDDFLPAVLTHEDYPDLIARGEKIDTIAVSCVLIAYNWPQGSDRHQRVAAFIEEFFSKMEEFRKPPRHPKWRESNLASVVPGWTRHEAAEEWLSRNRIPAISNERQQFDAYLTAQRGGSSSTVSAFAPEERERLFEDFLRWKETRERR